MNNASPYINPDFYNPLPSPVDLKSSPLAMLAKTCNSIGKDSPAPSKSSHKSSDKKESDKIEKAIAVDKTTSSPVESRESKSEKIKPAFRMLGNKDLASITSKSPSSDNPKRPFEPQTEVLDMTRSSPSCPKANNHVSSSPSRSSSPIRSKPAPCSTSLGITSPFGIKQHVASTQNGLSPSTLGYPGFQLLGHGLTPELAAAYHSQLVAHSSLYGYPISGPQSPSLKSVSSMSPYISYTRVRTSSGATALVPLCKDPYCTNCQLTVQTSHTSTTCKTPGCSQCAHEKALLGLSASSSAMGLPGSPLSLYPGLSSLPTSATGLSSLHSLYSHSALSAHQGLPYVCNWVSGHDYCGKRFNSSEELMQHLRSHTSSIDSGLPVGYGLGLPSSLSAASVGIAHLESPGSISPNSLRRGYPPTSLSPGLLTSSRFHPYKSPLGGLTTPSTTQHLSPLSAYFPYSLYAQRLGAAVP